MLKSIAKKEHSASSGEKMEERLVRKSMHGPDPGGAVFGLADLTDAGHADKGIEVTSEQHRFA